MPENANKVYVFQGTGAPFGNAVFSSLETAKAWIRRRNVTGVLTAYYPDDPGFDRIEREGTLPRGMLDKPVEPANVERYVDGREHCHFFLGVGEGDAGYAEACDRWHAEQGE